MESRQMLIVKCFTGESTARTEQVISVNGLHYSASLLLSHQFAGVMKTASVPAWGFGEDRKREG